MFTLLYCTVLYCIFTSPDGKPQLLTDVEDQLRECIPPFLAKDMAKAFDNFSRRISKFSTQSDYLYRKVKVNDDKGKQELEHDEKYCRLLYYHLRLTVDNRAELCLQGKAKELENGVQSLIQKQVDKLKLLLSEYDLENIVISNLEKKLSQDLPKLPENLFDFKDDIQTKTKTEAEKVGTETYYEEVKKTKNETRTRKYQEGSCFPQTRTESYTVPVTYTDTIKKTRDKYDNIEYINLTLPSPKLMAKHWTEGIEKEKSNLWDSLCDWFIKKLDEVSQDFESSANDILNLSERTLDEQLKIINSNFEEQKEFWTNLETKTNKVKLVYQELKINQDN